MSTFVLFLIFLNIVVIIIFMFCILSLGDYYISNIQISWYKIIFYHGIKIYKDFFNLYLVVI